MKKPERGSGWIEVSSSGLPTAARFQNPTRHEPQVAPFRITINPLKLTNFPVLVSS
jgi:hypothetical protein